MQLKQVGEIFGRTSTHGFKLKVSTLVSKWDYLGVKHPEVGPVLIQSVEVEKHTNETTAECMIIGYRTERGFLRKPLTPFEPGTPVFEAPDAFIKQVLGLKKEGLFLGMLEGKSKIKAFLDPKKLITKHLAVLAKSGAGKSYALGVLLEELASAGVPVVVVDPHGEYSSMRYPNDDRDDKKYFHLYDIEPRGFAQEVKEYAINTTMNVEASQIKLKIPTDPYLIIQTLPFKLSSAQKALLYSVVNDLQEKKSQFSFEDIIRELELIESNAKWRLIGGLQNLIKTGLFSFSPTPASEFVQPRQIAIINLKGAPIEFQEITVQTLLTELFEQRKLENISPFFLVVEEAHNFAPEKGAGEAKSSRVMRTIASEGRKFGLGLAVISQRPARVDKSVLSQCTSQIALQVTNPNDLRAIANAFEGITSETEKEIKNLPIGKALVIGASDYPIFVDVRVRQSRHGGRAKTFDIKSTDVYVNRNEMSSALEQVRSANNMIYFFEPRISRPEIVNLEQEEIRDIKLYLFPVLSITGRKSDQEFHLVVDMHGFSIFTLTDKLGRLRIPSNLANLSPNQKKVLEAAGAKGRTTVSELFSKTGLSFSEVSSIVTSLMRSNLLRAEGNTIIATGVTGAVNPARLNFPDKPRYVEEPHATKVAPRISEQKILSFLQAFGVQVSAKRQAYMPFYKVRTKSGKEKILDGFSYSLEM